MNLSNIIMEGDEDADAVKKLKDAVWLTWIRGVKSGMGCGSPSEMLKEYGFTGDFAGMGDHFSHPLEIAHALEIVFSSDTVDK